MLLSEEKAQTSIEYLLIVGGVTLAAIAIGLYLKETTRAISETISKTD